MTIDQLNQQYGTQSITPQGNFATAAAPVKQQSGGFGQFVGNVAHSLGNVASSVVRGVANQAAQGFTGLYHDYTGDTQVNPINARLSSLNQRQMQLIKDFHAGKISNADYKKGLQGLQQESQGISSDASKITKGSITGDVAKHYAQAAGTVLAVAAPELAAGAPEAGLLSDVPGIATAAKVADTLSPVNIGKGSALGIPFRNFVTQQTVGAGQQIGSDINNLRQGKNVGQNAKDLAGQAALMVGLPAALKAAPTIAEKAGQAFFGKPGLLNEVFGGDRFKAFLQAHPETEPIFRQMQQFTLNQPGVGGDVKRGAQFLTSHFENAIKQDPKAADLNQIVKNWQTYAKVASKAPEGLVASHDFTRAIPAAMKAIDQLPPEDFQNVATRVQAVNDVLDKLGIQNGTVRSNIGNALLHADNPEAFKSTLQDIAQKQIVQKAGRGFVYTFAPKQTAEIPKLGTSPELLLGKEANPTLGKIGSALTKAGLSPQGVDQKAVSANLQENFIKRFDQAGLQGNATSVLRALQNAEKVGAVDARSFTQNEVRGVLAKVAPELDPKAVQKALKQAYADVPRQLVGAGPKLLNQAIASTPMGKYLRAQSIGRYNANPFFWFKQDVKSAGIAKVEGAKLTNFATPETEKELLNRGYFGGGKLSDLSYSDQGTTNLIRPGQQRILGALAQSVADAHGTTVKQIFEDGGPLAKELDQKLNLVTSYGNGGYLNSPMAKTLNLLIFPSRFDTKIVMEAGKAISKMPVVGQAALFHGLGQAGQWLNSSDGQQWQKNNSELLGLIKYFTPAQSIDNAMKFLTGGGHVSDLGELGGLPVGVITTILDHQGVPLGKLGSSQYLDPKTGQPVPDKIPTTTKARIQQGLTDFLGSLFSYPGREVGLQSKTNLIQGVVPALKPAKGETKSVLKSGVPAPKASISKATPASFSQRSQLPKISAPKPAPITPKAAKVRTAKVKHFARPIGPR